MKSKFTGGVFEYWGMLLATSFFISISLGFATPWALCFYYKWHAKNSYIDGRQLAFTGTGMGFFGNWIKWFILTWITCGIYSLWLGVKLEEWKAEHTHFADSIED